MEGSNLTWLEDMNPPRVTNSQKLKADDMESVELYFLSNNDLVEINAVVSVDSSIRLDNFDSIFLIPSIFEVFICS